jgi:hypothetical protein
MIVPRRPDSLSPFRLVRLTPAGIHRVELVLTSGRLLQRLPMRSSFAGGLATRAASLAGHLVRGAGDRARRARGHATCDVFARTHFFRRPAASRRRGLFRSKHRRELSNYGLQLTRLSLRSTRAAEACYVGRSQFSRALLRELQSTFFTIARRRAVSYGSCTVPEARSCQRMDLSWLN